jgi:erythromycin esterase-like protein
MAGSPGGRDKAMSQLLLDQLGTAGASVRCVLWAHNAHVQKSPMHYTGTDELAMGGYLAEVLGKGYYALGVTFGEGGFQANAVDADGHWGFKRYTHRAAPKGSLEWQLGSVHPGDLLLDLRSAPQDTLVQHWLTMGHGTRWWGGYNVPDDVDANTPDAAHLWQAHPITDYDGLVYLAHTTPAQPIDPERILPASKR